MSDVVGAFAELVGQLVLPDVSLAGVDRDAYVSCYRACLESRVECIRLVVGNGVRGLSLLEGEVRDYVTGIAETVVSSVPAVTKLSVDGKEFAEAAVGCVVDPAGCLGKGKNYYENRRKRERRKKARSAERVVVDAKVVSAGEGEVESSLAARRVAENELAVLKAKAQIALVQDPLVKAAREDMGRKRAVVAAATSAAQYEKQMAELESVSPGSSVSLFEVRALEKEKALLDLKAYRLEQLAREYAPKEAVIEILKGLDGDDEIEHEYGSYGKSGTCDVVRAFDNAATGGRVDALGCRLEADW